MNHLDLRPARFADGVLKCFVSLEFLNRLRAISRALCRLYEERWSKNRINIQGIAFAQECVHESQNTIREFEGTVKQILVKMEIFRLGHQYFDSFLAWTFSKSPIILREGQAFKETRIPLFPESLLTPKSGVFSSNHVSLYAMA
jgi:hypothetical protein